MFICDVIVDLFYDCIDCRYFDFDVLLVVMLIDVFDEMVVEFLDVFVFLWVEFLEYEGCIVVVKLYIFDQQEVDVFDVFFVDKGVECEMVEEYVEYVYVWVFDGQIEIECGLVDFDLFLMKLFEIEYFGCFLLDDYEGNEFFELVEEFCNEKVIIVFNCYVWENCDEGFIVFDVDFIEILVIWMVFEIYDWEDVCWLFVDFDFCQWDDLLVNIEMVWVKVCIIDELVDCGYIVVLVELISCVVMKEVSYIWD